MSLYSIDAAILDVIERGFAVNAETGEVWEPEDLEALEAERESKVEGVACYIKNLDAEAAAIRAEEKALAERRQATERKAERMREYLADSLQRAGQGKFATSRCALSFRRSEAVEIVDESAISKDWITYKPSIDKAGIKKALKAGEAVSGAQLVERQNLQIK